MARSRWGMLPWLSPSTGVSMWVTNAGDNAVTRLRSTDGLNIGTFPTGRVPIGIAFDGANMWLANNADSNGMVSKL